MACHSEPSRDRAHLTLPSTSLAALLCVQTRGPHSPFNKTMPFWPYTSAHAFVWNLLLSPLSSWSESLYEYPPLPYVCLWLLLGCRLFKGGCAGSSFLLTPVLLRFFKASLFQVVLPYICLASVWTEAWVTSPALSICLSPNSHIYTPSQPIPKRRPFYGAAAPLLSPPAAMGGSLLYVTYTAVPLWTVHYCCPKVCIFRFWWISQSFTHRTHPNTGEWC